MKLAVLGMHRSGTNVVGRWLLRQSDLGDKELKFTENCDWIEKDEMGAYGFVSQVNHPQHYGWKQYTELSKSVVTVEREGLDYFAEFCHEYKYSWHGAVIVVRDFRNWLASAYKMGGCKVPDIDIQKYVSHLNALTGQQRWLVPIIYNLWCKSAQYRSEICTKLKLDFTDYGYNDVPPNGGGSSFDLLKYQGKGQEMDVEKRFLNYYNDVEFQDMLKQYDNVCKLSDYWISKVRME